VTDSYRFITRWRFQATADAIYSILSEPTEYPRWWPSVYLMVRQLAPGHVRLLTRGWLPYRLRWDATNVEAHPPSRLTIRASGDFKGEGVWSIVKDGEFCDVTFDWKVNAIKPLLRYLTFLLRPAFEANHRWAMEQGSRSLELEIARYNASTVEEMNTVAAAPPPAELLRADIIGGAILSAAVIGAILPAFQNTRAKQA